jgi:hypothetical protein
MCFIQAKPGVILTATLIHKTVGCREQRTPMHTVKLCYTLRKWASGVQCHAEEKLVAHFLKQL